MTRGTHMDLNNPQPSNLRPTPEQTFAAWTKLVLDNREQIERLRERQPAADFYQSRSGQFRPDRRPSPELPYLLELTGPDDHWLDIGAGGGRFAVPIAEHVAAVHAVEPSPAMRDTLSAAAADAGLSNIQTYEEVKGKLVPRHNFAKRVKKAVVRMTPPILWRQRLCNRQELQR